jgi:peptidoglycan/LPS O-acetylase OafA/YrhL
MPFRRLFFPIIEYGKLSYEVYLTHMFIVYSGIRLYNYYGKPLDFALLWLLAIILISGLIGYIIENYFSAPMNRKIRGIR